MTGGAVIGKTDPIGSAPVTPAYSPMDLGATIYAALCADYGAQVRDQMRRPVALNTGKPIAVVYG